MKYIDVHLCYTIPTLLLLLSAIKPFLTIPNVTSAVLLCIVAFIYTTPWDNYVIVNGAWGYQNGSVLGVIGYVPLEEYAFFIIQTLGTGALWILVGRWRLTILGLRNKSKAIRIVPCIGFVVQFALGWMIAIPQTPTFYLGCILWWTAPPFFIQWYTSGRFIYAHLKTIIPVIAISTMYLVWVDHVALQHGAWHIRSESIVGIMITKYVPLEEFLFFTMSNAMVVFGLVAIERSLAIMRVLRRCHSNLLDSKSSLFGMLLVATFTSEESLDQVYLEDLETSYKLILAGSKSFAVASALFPQSVREDMIALYAVCRFTDDITDDPDATPSAKQDLLNIVDKHLDQMYHQNSGSNNGPDKDSKDCIKMSSLPLAQLPTVQMSALRCFSKIIDKVPRHCIKELFEGYAMDINKVKIITESDLITYAAHVAASVGEACAHIMCKNENPNWEASTTKSKEIIRRARDMGIAFQLVNCARDIGTDAEEIHRCYVPSEWFGKEGSDQLLQNPFGDLELLKALALRLISLGDMYRTSAEIGIGMLSKSNRLPILASLRIYFGISEIIKAHSTYPKRAATSIGFKLMTLLQTLYVS